MVEVKQIWLRAKATLAVAFIASPVLFCAIKVLANNTFEHIEASSVAVAC